MIRTTVSFDDRVAVAAFNPPPSEWRVIVPVEQADARLATLCDLFINRPFITERDVHNVPIGVMTP